MLVNNCGKRVQHRANSESGLLRSLHHPQNLQGRDQAVARGAEIAHDDVAALLAPQVEVLLAHGGQHVLIAHPGADGLAAGRGDGGLQPGVAHDGGRQCFFGQGAGGQLFQGENGHDVVAVNERALFVAQQDAVGVAVVGQADVGLVLADQAAEVLRVHRRRSPC